jgi:hypothetical protein
MPFPTYDTLNQKLEECKIIISLIMTLILTYLLTPWSRILLEKLTGFAASREIPHIL